MSYPPPPPSLADSSIWGPNQSHKSTSSSSSNWSRMQGNFRSDQAESMMSLQDVSLTGKDSSSYPFPFDDLHAHHDVFGPVMSNGAYSTHGAEPRRNVGAIGDRRKKDNSHRPPMSNLQQASDPSSTFAVDQLLRALEFSPTVAPDTLLRQHHANTVGQFAVQESPSTASSNSSSPGGMLDMLHTPSDTWPLMHRHSNSLGSYGDKLPMATANPKSVSAYLEPYTGQFSGRTVETNSVRDFSTTISQIPTSIYDTSSYNPLASSNVLFQSSSNSVPNAEKALSSSGLFNIISQHTPSGSYQGHFNPFGNDLMISENSLTRLRNDPLSSNINEAFSSPWPPQGPSIPNIAVDKGTSVLPTSLSQNAVLSSSTQIYYGTAPRRSSTDSIQPRSGRNASPFEQKPAPPFSPSTTLDFQRPQQHYVNPPSMPIHGTEQTNREYTRVLAPSPLPRPREKQHSGSLINDRSAQPSPVYHSPHTMTSSPSYAGDKHSTNEPINFLHLLSPTAVPPYSHFINRIVKSSDQQASIFLQQKLKIADAAERKKIVDAVSQKGIEMMTNRFGNWAVQRCLEPPCELADRMKIVQCMRGHVVELATNCYGTHVLQKALDCDEDIRLLIVSELLLGDPSSTLLNKHSAHVWSKIMELTWTPPAPPIFAYVNKSLAGKWASLACHETGSLVVQTAFEQCEDADKELIIGELLDEEAFAEVVTNAWGNFCILHLLEHGASHHKARAIDNLINGLSQYASHEQSIKSILKALKEGGPEVLDKFVTRLCEPPKGGRRASLVDISLSPIGSQLIGTILPSVNKEQRSALYEAIRGHVVTLRGSRVGSKVIWLFDRMRAYYGY